VDKVGLHTRKTEGIKSSWRNAVGSNLGYGYRRPPGPWPSLVMAATCANVIEHDPTRHTLEGVAGWFNTEWRATPEMQAPVSFFVYAELFACDFEPAADETLRLEIDDANGSTNQFRF
jgi:hypothetical protein